MCNDRGHVSRIHGSASAEHMSLKQTDPIRSSLSALPSQAARLLAFLAIVVGGLAGAVIGYGVVKVQCTGKCATQEAIGAILGALFIGIGVAVIAVLVLRAMGEWNAVKERDSAVILGSKGELTQDLKRESEHPFS